MMRAIASLIILLACAAPQTGWGKPKKAKNVILLLADAGGVATVNAASIHGYNAPLKLYIQSWPHIGLSDTTPVGSWVSDSAAGMTAIVTGQKTRNGVVSQGPDAIRGKKDGTPLKTILEYAEEKGLSTGVISDMPITDATPAACYAQVNDRSAWGKIFLQLFTPRFGDGVDILFGPGRKRIWESAAKANLDIDASARARNRPIYASLNEVPPDADRAIAVVDSGFDLNAAAKRALKSLSKNRKGFFLMIESDAHTDNPQAGLDRLVAFDKLIREIATMVNLNETLLLFTADHSFDLRVTGGTPDKPLLSGLAEWRAQNPRPRNVRIPALQVDGSHSAEEVIVAAQGAGAERVRGFMPNTHLFHIMLAAWGWKP
jgi:alkaline phosphatase